MPKDAPRKSLHFFNSGEAALQRRFGVFRQKLFKPILIVLTVLGIGPDVLTILGMLSMLLLPASFIYSIPGLAIGAFVLHLFFDALDGPLARHQKATSAGGAYTDVVADHFALLFTAFTLLWFGIGDPFWLSLYASAYVIVILHVILLNVRETPLPLPIIRTRWPFFLLVVCTAYGWDTFPILGPFLMIAALYYVVMLPPFILRLRWSLQS